MTQALLLPNSKWLQFVKALRYKRKCHEFHSWWGSLGFFIDLMLPAAQWAWGLLSIYQKW